jgi:Leucine-rich repeat (LRR) protein
LSSLITDLKIGGFIRIRSAAGVVTNIQGSTISSLSLADNSLTDGEELAQFLSFLPNLNKLTLSNNAFVELPSNTLHKNPKLESLNMFENPMMSFPESFFDKQKIAKKSSFKFSCSMKFIPVDLLSNPKTIKSFLKVAQFC